MNIHQGDTVLANGQEYNVGYVHNSDSDKITFEPVGEEELVSLKRVHIVGKKRSMTDTEIARRNRRLDRAEALRKQHEGEGE